MSRSPKLKTSAVVLLPFALLFCLSCGKGQGTEKGGDDAVPVELAAVIDTSISSYITAAANLEPEKRADVLAKVEGTIVSIEAEEGHNVGNGRVLARLDGSELTIERDRARIRAQAEKTELERAVSLHAKGLLSDKDFAAQKSAYELAEAELEAAELRLSYTTIRAPFSGKVTRRLVDLGETVRIGLPLFTVEDTSPLLCKIHLPSHLIPSIEVGQTAKIFPGTSAESPITGKVRMISPVVDPATGTVKVTLELDEHVGSVRPGAFADIKMVADTHYGVPAIPRKAILSEGGDLFVFAAGSDTVRRIRVTTGYEQDDLVEVLTGLAPGDSVVVVGHGGIEEGTKIKVVQAPGSMAALTDSAAVDSLETEDEAPAPSAADDSTGAVAVSDASADQADVRGDDR